MFKHLLTLILILFQINLLVNGWDNEAGIKDSIAGQGGPDEPGEEDGEGEEDTLVLLVLESQRPVDLTFCAAVGW